MVYTWWWLVHHPLHQRIERIDISSLAKIWSTSTLRITLIPNCLLAASDPVMYHILWVPFVTLATVRECLEHRISVTLKRPFGRDGCKWWCVSCRRWCPVHFRRYSCHCCYNSDEQSKDWLMHILGCVCWGRRDRRMNSILEWYSAVIYHLETVTDIPVRAKTGSWDLDQTLNPRNTIGLVTTQHDSQPWSDGCIVFRIWTTQCQHLCWRCRWLFADLYIEEHKREGKLSRT